MGTIRPYIVKTDVKEDQTSYTIDIDLPDTGRFSYLNLLVKARTTTTGDCPGPWVKYLISSVSLNQGGQAHLNACTPEMFQADAWYKTGKFATRGYKVAGGASAEIIESIPIMFGETPNDPNYGIDLSKLSDPQISITYDLATTGVLGETIWDTSYYPRFTPILYLQEGTWPVLQGYQSLRQIDKYTPSDSEEHKTELKGNALIKRIYAQLDLVNCQYGTIHSIDKVKLHGDNKQWIPIDYDYDWWMEVIRDTYGPVNIDALVYYIGSGTTLDSMVDRRISMFLNPHASLTHTGIMYSGSGRTVKPEWILTADGTTPTVVNYGMMNITGLIPWSAMVIDAPKMLGKEWIDPAEHPTTYIEIDHVSNAATIGGPFKIHVADKQTQ